MISDKLDKYEFKYIEEHETEVLKLFTEGKMIGVSTLYVVATEMDAQCQADYYKTVKSKGVKHRDSVAMLERCAEGVVIPTLFDMWEY